MPWTIRTKEQDGILYKSAPLSGISRLREVHLPFPFLFPVVRSWGVSLPHSPHPRLLLQFASSWDRQQKAGSKIQVSEDA